MLAEPNGAQLLMIQIAGVVLIYYPKCRLHDCDVNPDSIGKSALLIIDRVLLLGDPMLIFWVSLRVAHLKAHQCSLGHNSIYAGQPLIVERTTCQQAVN